MRLTSLKLRNYRGFEHTQLDLEPDVTVLLGKNGAGKTAILNAALYGLLSMVGDEGALEITRTTGTMDSDVRSGASGYDISLKLTLEEDEREVHLHHQRGMRPSWSADRWLAEPAIAAASPMIVRLGSRRIRSNLASGLNFRAIATDDTSAPHRLAWADEPVADLVQWFETREDIENEARLREDPDFRLPDLERVRTTIVDFMNAMGDGHTYSSLRISRTRRNDPASPDAHGMERLVVDKDGRSLDFTQLSDGERMLMYCVGEIARRRRRPDGEPTADEGIVLIDQVELDLHPDWQRRVLPALGTIFPTLQFVVATHSPQVLASVPSRCVRMLEDFVIVQTAPSHGRDTNSILTDVFGVLDRPAEFRKRLSAIAIAIDDGRLEDASQGLSELKERVGDSDPDVLGLERTLEFLH